MVVLPVLLGAAAMYWFAGRMPKTYRADGSVYVGSQAPVVLDIRAVAPEETRDLEQMRSVEQGMSASTLLMRVIDANGWRMILHSRRPGRPPGLGAEVRRTGLGGAAPRHADHRYVGGGHRSGAGEASGGVTGGRV